MSEKSISRHVQRGMGWTYTRALHFVREHRQVAIDMRTEGEAETVKNALLELAQADSGGES